MVHFVLELKTTEDLRSIGLNGTPKQMRAVTALNDALRRGERVNYRKMAREIDFPNLPRFVGVLRRNNLPLPKPKMGSSKERLMQLEQIVQPGETQDQAARRLGVSTRWLVRIERVHRPPIPPIPMRQAEISAQIRGTIDAIFREKPGIGFKEVAKELSDRGYPDISPELARYYRAHSYMQPTAIDREARARARAKAVVTGVKSVMNLSKPPQRKIPPTPPETLSRADRNAGIKAAQMYEERLRASTQGIPMVQGGVNPTEPVFNTEQNKNE